MAAIRPYVIFELISVYVTDCGFIAMTSAGGTDHGSTG